MNDPTLAVYEKRAGEWEARRAPARTDHAARFAADVRATRPDAVIADLGCGPGWYARDLGPGPVLAFDGARAMLDLVPSRAPGATLVQGDLRALPFRRGALHAAWASKSYVHLARRAVPLALADLHRSLTDDALVELVVFGGDQEHGEFPDDPFGGRRFSLWPPELLRTVVEGAGFEIVRFGTEKGKRAAQVSFRLRLRRLRTLPDFVGPHMRMLLVGLNPSLYSADRGMGFARAGNRFWPAALAAGIVTRDRDPVHALVAHATGMTDMVKRATTRADELERSEYRAGHERLARLVRWLQPTVVCVVGLTGWRIAVDRKAIAGPQSQPLENSKVYVMPNTSGLNARVPLIELSRHLRAAYELGG